MKPTTPAQPRAGVEVGDHLYVQHRGQACAGIVQAHGRHGVTVDVDGQPHKLKWDKVLGHKKRAEQRYEMIDDGEDGMLVKDHQGKQRYVAVPNEAKEDPLVTKSIGHRPVVFFMKSTVEDAKPLAKKKTGAWQDAGDYPAQAGHHVGFENGEHKGHGEVTATGKHGLTVKDAAGGEHRVKHEQVTHQWDGDDAPNESPHKDTAKQDEALDEYDGKVPLPPELIAEMLKQAAPELREKAAAFLLEKQAGAEIEERAAALSVVDAPADAKKD